MQRECLKCGRVNVAASGSVHEGCPQCGAIYSKVQAHQDALAAASMQREAEQERMETAAAERAAEFAAIAARAAESARSGAAGAQAPMIRTRGVICLACGQMGYARSWPRGSLALELSLWVVGLLTLLLWIGIPILICALIYSTWRIFSRRRTCRMCKSEQIIPTKSPRGQELQAERIARSAGQGG